MCDTLWRYRAVTTNTDVTGILIVPKDVELEMILGLIVECTFKGLEAVVSQPYSIDLCFELFMAPAAKAVEMF